MQSGDAASLQHDSPTDYLQSLIERAVRALAQGSAHGPGQPPPFPHRAGARNRPRDALGRSRLLLMLDIDCFKAVNDTYGHHAGDLVLQSVARTLSGCVRPMDTVVALWRRGIRRRAARLPVRLRPGGGRAGRGHARAHLAHPGTGRDGERGRRLARNGCSTTQLFGRNVPIISSTAPRWAGATASASKSSPTAP